MIWEAAAWKAGFCPQTEVSLSKTMNLHQLLRMCAVSLILNLWPPLERGASKCSENTDLSLSDECSQSKWWISRLSHRTSQWDVHLEGKMSPSFMRLERWMMWHIFLAEPALRHLQMSGLTRMCRAKLDYMPTSTTIQYFMRRSCTRLLRHGLIFLVP